MRIIKTAKQHRLYPKKSALATLLSKNGCRLSILIFLFQFFPSFLFVQGGSLVWALRFPTPPRAIDDINEDTVFSPNGDGVQDTLLISFITDGDFGDFRIIIDTHGSSGVGSPDGQFRFDEDWVITGELGPGISEEDLPRTIREAWDGNDFSRQQEDKNPRLLKDGRYRIQVEIDDAPNGEVNRTESGYLSVRLLAIIDNTVPELSSTISQLDLSPNGDNIIDEVQIDYRLSEDLEELELQFTNPSGRPAVSLTGLSDGDHSFKWGGTDGLGTILTDGVYTAQLHGADKGGNVGTFGIDTIQIDTEPPTIVQLTPSRNSFQNTPIEQIEVIFDIDDGSLIDVDSTFTEILLLNSNGAQISGVISHDEEAGRITRTLDRSLDSSDENGVYTISVSAADKAGNIVTDEISFTFDNVAPTVTSIVTDVGELTPDTSTTTKFTFLDVTLADNIDSRVNTASTIHLSGAEGTAVAGIQSQVGENGIRWTPGFPLATDGSYDGRYIITVQSRDRAGNEVEIQIPFIYDTQVSELVLTSESGVQLNTSPGAEAFLTSSLSVLTATFNDGEGGGIDFSKTSIAMFSFDQAGQIPIPVSMEGTLTSDENNDTLEFRLDQPLERRNGTQDGTYLIRVRSTDKAGNAETRTIELVYDTQAPTIVSTIRTANPLTTQQIEVELEVTDTFAGGEGSGFDASASTFELFDVNGAMVDGAQTNDGAGRFAFRSRVLPEGGMYVLVVTLADRAGNRSIPLPLIYDAEEPTIETVSHIDPTATVSNVSDFLTRLEATVSDVGTGIDFDRSLIQLLNAAGAVVPGTPYHDDEGTIGWELSTPLTREGNFDGLYSVRVSAVDKAGYVEERTFALRYDTQVPIIQTAFATQNDGTPVELSGVEAELITSSINQITVRLSDGEGSGMDVLRTTVSLIGPEGTPVGTNQSDNGSDTVYLSFNPLRADGFNDGFYRVQVTPTDLAGNTLTSSVEFPFFYSTRKPEVIATTPAEFASVTHLTEVAATLQDHSGQGIDFDRATILLKAPDQSIILGHQTADEAQSSITWELNQPLSRNGSVDGGYTIQLSVVDKAGNSAEVEHTFVYDTLIPTVVSVMANTDPPTVIPSTGLTAIETSFNGLTIQLSDANGETTPVSGIDLVGTGVQLLGPGKTPLSVNTRDDGVDTIIVSFASLYQPGTYTLEITPQDMAGNVSSHAVEYEFGLELGYSTVSAVTIGGRMAPVEFVNRLDEIVATLEDVSATGLNLTSDGSTITVAGPNGEVDGVQTSRGGNQIVWRPLQLATDGSTDGVYTATVTPVNSGGRLGIPARHQFTLDTQEPEVASVTPIDLTQPLSYIGRQLIQIAAQVEDVGPAGLKIEDQRLQLLDAGGNLVPATQSDDRESQIFLTLSQPLTADGSDDGVYTVSLELMDKASNLRLLSHQLVYDTQAPTLVSTNPTDGSLRSDDITVITARLNDLGGSGIDFAESTLTLLDLTGTPVSGVQSNDGNRRLTLQINGLVADGNYTIRVEAIDRAGNGSSAPFETQFTFSSGMPVVVSTVPKTTPAEEAFTNESIGQVSVELQSEDGGVDRSTITLLAPDGTTVPGQQARRGKVLIYRLLQALATDGSDDGTYTIVVIPINSAGRQGEPQQFTFVYDTVVPEVIPASIQLIVAEPGVNNSLVSVGALIADDEPSSGVDWDNLNLSWITLGDVTRNRKIDGTLATDEEQALLLNLIMPLASDGSQDGVYLLTIAPKDRAGNVSEAISYPFFYDTRPPTIDTSSLFIDGQPLLTDSNDPYYPSATNKSGSIIIDAKFSDINPDGSYGLGPDLVNSSISVSSPSGEVITGTTTQNGTDSIRFKSGPLDEQGHYQVTITSVGSDAANLGFQPTDSVTTQFLFETTKPVAELTDLVGETTFEDEPLPLQGTARDLSEEDIPASEVAMVEVVGTGPDGLPINPVAVKDDSEEEEDPWSRWSIDFLPSQSGEYNLDVRVTDRAGNAGIYDAVTVNFSVSLIFKGPTYVWPNPLSLSRRSNDEIAHFSFEVNVPGGEGARIVLSIYDFAGDLVYEKEYNDLGTGRSDNEVRWDLTNQSGTDVARGIYIFRLEAEDVVTSNRTNAVGKIVVVE